MDRWLERPLSKIVACEQISLVCAEHRKAGRAVVLTNGCFDLLHVGHLATLAEARACGDVLVVGLNSDAGVRQLKGDGRPIQPEQDRALLLAGLEVVDHVVVFDHPTARELLEAVQPEVYVKGGDYTADTLPEAPVVQRLGCRLHLVPVRPGRSTTLLAARLKGS